MRIVRLIKKNLLFILLIAVVGYILLNNMNMEGFQTDQKVCKNPTLVAFGRAPSAATAAAANAACGGGYEAVVSSSGNAYCVKKCSVISYGYEPANNQTWNQMCKPINNRTTGFNRWTDLANRKAC